MEKTKSDSNLAIREKEDAKAERAPEGAAGQPSPTGALSDYEKRKKKDFSSEYGSQSSGTSSFTSGGRPEEDAFERKRKKDYDYDALFQKQETGSTNDTRLRQQYQTQQAYRSVSTSGSRTSLDAGSVEIKSDVSLEVKGKAGSQLEVVKSKSEIKAKKGKGEWSLVTCAVIAAF